MRRVKVSRRSSSSSSPDSSSNVESNPTWERPWTHEHCVSMQNTHWYQSGIGWTSNPEHAYYWKEVERVGLHNCASQGCAKRHAGDAEEYVRLQLLKQWAEDGYY